MTTHLDQAKAIDNAASEVASGIKSAWHSLWSPPSLENATAKMEN
jgi:hypothetical protein